MKLLKIQCKSAGVLWPDILYTIQSDIEQIITYLQNKEELIDDRYSIEHRCGSKEITMTFLPDEKYVVYLGIPASMEEESCIVEYKECQYKAHKQLLFLLNEIIGNSG